MILGIYLDMCSNVCQKHILITFKLSFKLILKLIKFEFVKLWGTLGKLAFKANIVFRKRQIQGQNKNPIFFVLSDRYAFNGRMPSLGMLSSSNCFQFS